MKINERLQMIMLAMVTWTVKCSQSSSSIVYWEAVKLRIEHNYWQTIAFSITLMLVFFWQPLCDINCRLHSFWLEVMKYFTIAPGFQFTFVFFKDLKFPVLVWSCYEAAVEKQFCILPRQTTTLSHYWYVCKDQTRKRHQEPQMNIA